MKVVILQNVYSETCV